MEYFNINLPSDYPILTSPWIQTSNTKCMISNYYLLLPASSIDCFFKKLILQKRYLFNHASNVFLLHILVLSPHFVLFSKKIFAKKIDTTNIGTSFSFY